VSVHSTHAEARQDSPRDVHEERAGESRGSRLLRLLLTNRMVLLVVLIVLILAVFVILDAAGVLSGSYNASYLLAALINLVPLGMLAMAEMLVITAGAGGIDLSVGSMVSLVGMAFGFMYGLWGWPLISSIIAAVLLGALLGAVNGVLVARLGFPPLISTLATYYAYWSLALVINDQQPISTEPIQDLYGLSKSVDLFGLAWLAVPKGALIFFLPTLVVVWLALSKSSYGRRLYAVGTNEVAAAWSGINVVRTRGLAYVASGAISGLVAVVTVSQFASARPDAGTTGDGMALPAVTIAVLGGVAVFGGVARTSGIALATLLVVWLNAGLLLAFPGNAGSQARLLALGAILVGCALLNTISERKYSGER